MILDAERHTSAAALLARDGLATHARAAAGSRNMAALAKGALFEEALLGALRARFNELRTVAK